MKVILKISVLTTALLFSSFVFYSFPPRCAASAMSGLCAGVINVIEGERDKAAGAVKACKKNCRWTNRKREILETVHKKAKESCARGEAPDVKEADKALGGDAKARLKNLYDRNNRLFDGKEKLPDKDFEPNPSRQSAVLTGKGGGVADLKAYEPAIPRLNSAPEFSLNKPTTLPASAKTALSPQKAPVVMAAGDWTDVICKCPDGRILGKMSVDQCVKRCKPAPKPPTPGPGWDYYIPNLWGVC